MSSAGAILDALGEKRMTTLQQSNDEQLRKKAELARGMLSNFTDRAVQILQELAEYAENDRVRLSAVNSILDRAGVVAPTEVHVTATQEEHDLVRREAEDVLIRMQRNVEQRAITGPRPSLEALVVLEDEGDPVATTQSDVA